MENTNAQLAIPNQAIAQKLNDSVFSVIGQDAEIGFNKAFLIANAISELKGLLTPQYMKPIMELQGNRLGFKTDKDREGGYDEKTVKNCLIEAVLFGLQPYNNEFNIIAGNMYPTKEGMGSLLKKIKGLDSEIIPLLPRINADSTSAAIVMRIMWSLNGGEKKTREIEIPIKMNKFMGTDAVIGKATRKARAWLFATITGNEIPDGDVTDTLSTVMETRLNNEISLEELTELFELKKELLTPDEIIRFEKILDKNNPEKNSFKKLNEYLKTK